jgi:maltose-binding protein MalE
MMRSVLNIRCLTFSLFFLLSLVIILPNPTTTAAPSYQEEGTVRLRIWWPNSLLPPSADTTLEDVMTGFAATDETVALEVRYRAYRPVGTVDDLVLTRNVAPDALPELVLMRHSDMQLAVDERLIQPIEGWAPVNILAELSQHLLEIGTANSTLYGLPYLLEIQHMIYQTESLSIPPRSTEDILEQQIPLIFNATSPEEVAVNDFLLAQYLAAGGRLVNAEGSPALNEDILIQVLTFFANAREDELIDPSLLDYTQRDAAYLNAFVNASQEEQGLALLDSRTFLTEYESLLQDYSVSRIPTASQEPFTFLNGWVWVLLTQNPEQQLKARSFITYLMSLDRAPAIADSLNMLPSQENALRIMSGGEYIDVMSGLLENATFIPQDRRNNAAARALQAAFVQVMEGTPPEEAAAEAITNLES